LLQRVNQPTVAHAVLARSGVDARDPQPAEVALAALAADVGVLPRLVQDLARLLEAVFPGTPEALGLLEDAITTTTGFEPSLHTCHFSSPSALRSSRIRKQHLDALLEMIVHGVAFAQAPVALAVLAA